MPNVSRLAALICYTGLIGLSRVELAFSMQTVLVFLLIGGAKDVSRRVPRPSESILLIVRKAGAASNYQIQLGHSWSLYVQVCQYCGRFLGPMGKYSPWHLSYKQRDRGCHVLVTLQAARAQEVAYTVLRQTCAVIAFLLFTEKGQVLKVSM